MDAEDGEIEVPDCMYFVTTPCAMCGEQFYLMTLEADGAREYTCPDCKTLAVSTKSGVARVSLLLAHHRCPDLRRVADPQLMAQLGQQALEPARVSRGLDAHPHWSLQPA